MKFQIFLPLLAQSVLSRKLQKMLKNEKNYEYQRFNSKLN